MPFLAWILFGAGVYFMGIAAMNKPPRETFLRIIRGEDIASLQWFLPPNPSQGNVFGAIGAIGGGGGNPSGGGTGGAVGGAVGGALANSREKVVAFGRAQLGERYVFGSAGPDTWDCSGLTQQAYKQVGVKLPHHAASQQRMGQQITEANAQPGDLVFWGVIASHVGIYLGGGQVLHAPKTGDVVKISPIWDKRRVTYRRYL